MNTVSAMISDTLDSCNDKESFLSAVSGMLSVDGATFTKLDYNIMLERASQLRCKTKFIKLYDEYSAKLLEISPEIPPYIFIKNNKAAVDPVALADYIADTEYYIFVQSRDREDKRLFWYENGVYNRISVSVVKSKIKEIISKYDRSLATVKAIEETFKQIGYTRDSHYIANDEILNQDTNIINFENGILNLKTMTLDAHSPEYLSTVQIPCKWCSIPQETPIFDKFIEHLARGEAEAKQTLLEFIGFVISNIHIKKYKKSLFLIGAGNSGKTQFINMICDFIGRDNYCSLPFSRLENRFSAASLYQKRLAVDDDCRAVGCNEVSVFKSMTGGGSLSGEEKGAMSYSMIYHGAYIVAANDVPLFGGDKGEHVYQRILPIQCGDSIPEKDQDKDLREKLYSERQGIITKAVLALKQTIENNYTFTIGNNSAAALGKYKIENDSCLMFFEECCEATTSPKDACNTAQLWNAFREWCNITNEYCPKRRIFNKTMAEMLNISEYSLIKASMGKRYYPLTLKAEMKEELHIYDGISRRPQLYQVK